MNVYFLDPTYIKDSAWKPLLTVLKVKSVFSFIPKNQLSPNLYWIIKPMLRTISYGESRKFLADHCAYWLRSMIERYVTLFTSEYPYEDCPKEIRQNYTTVSPLHNILKFDSPNCLVLLHTKTNPDFYGTHSAPRSDVDLDMDLAEYVSKYCLNILHKKYQHYHYNSHTSFVLFDEFLGQSFRYNTITRCWQYYNSFNKNEDTSGFINRIYKEVNRLAPNLFPIDEQNGKYKFTLLINEEGAKKYELFEEKLNNSIEEYEWECKRKATEEYEHDLWQHDVEEMNRAFWEECGEFGPNCESWPGW